MQGLHQLNTKTSTLFLREFNGMKSTPYLLEISGFTPEGSQKRAVDTYRLIIK